MIDPDAHARGHRYQTSPMGGAVWCYKHDVPTFPCDYDDEETEYTDEEYAAARAAGGK
jgi:hypothetical protein